MRLRTKFLFLFLASGLFLLVEGLAAAWSLRVIGNDVDNLQIYTQTDDLCGQIKVELAQLPKPEELARKPHGKARRQLKQQADRTMILCRSLEKLATSDSSQAAVDEIKSSVWRYRTAGVDYSLALEEAGTEGEAPWTERKQAERAHDEVIRIQEQGVIEPVGHEARLATKAVVDRADTLNTWVTIGGLSLSVVFTVIAAVFLARATAHPIVRIMRAAREVSRGNLHVEVPSRSDDELGELGQAFNEMTSRLRESREWLEEEVRKRTEELRRREKDLELERRLAAIGRLAAGVAHEVGNPLTVIAGAAEGLRDRAQDDALQEIAAFEDFPEYLETIESEAYRLKRVVRRLLDFSRKAASPFTPLDLRQVVRDAVSLARLEPRAKEHPVHFEDPESELPIHGDADALQEATLNLLFNALAAVEATGGEVTVRLVREDQEAVLAIEDTGEGIDPQDQDRLFEPFFTTKEAGEGTGLGLALVYGTVERHGGTITCVSKGKESGGTTFTMRIPVHAKDTETEDEPQPPTSGA